MPETVDGTFPPIQERPQMQWVKDLSARGVPVYAARRLRDITKDRAGIIEVIRSFPECSGLPDALVDYLALSFATLATDSYENGIQVGVEEERRRTQGQRDREFSVRINMQSAVG